MSTKGPVPMEVDSDSEEMGLGSLFDASENSSSSSTMTAEEAPSSATTNTTEELEPKLGKYPEFVPPATSNVGIRYYLGAAPSQAEIDKAQAEYDNERFEKVRPWLEAQVETKYATDKDMLERIRADESAQKKPLIKARQLVDKTWSKAEVRGFAYDSTLRLNNLLETLKAFDKTSDNKDRTDFEHAAKAKYDQMVLNKIQTSEEPKPAIVSQFQNKPTYEKNAFTKRLQTGQANVLRRMQEENQAKQEQEYQRAKKIMG